MYPTESELRRIRELPRGKQTEHFIYNLLLPKILGYWAFHGPKHAGKELADILVWWEDVVLLIEAKTRDTTDHPKESWIREKLRDAIESINDRAGMLRRGEVDVLRNKWRGEVKWDPSGVKDYIGIVVMHHNSNPYDPAEIAADAYKASKVPIAVISFEDFLSLVLYESTIWDLITYFEARFQLWRYQPLLVHDEYEIYQAVWTHWPDLVAGHGTEEDLRETQKYQITIGKAIQRADTVSHEDYEKLAASYLLHYCVGAMVIEADRDEAGRPISSVGHDFAVNAIGWLAEISRLRRTKYGIRWLNAAREIVDTTQTVEVMGYSPSRDRAYLFAAFGDRAVLPVKPYLTIVAKEHMKESQARSCLCLGARAKDIIATYEVFLAAVKGDDLRNFDEWTGLPFDGVFVKRNQ